MELHPALAFGCAIAGASISGIVGAFLALPFAAIVQALGSTYHPPTRSGGDGADARGRAREGAKKIRAERKRSRTGARMLRRDSQAGAASLRMKPVGS